MNLETTRRRYPDLFLHCKDGQRLEGVVEESEVMWLVLGLVLVGLVFGGSVWLFLNIASQVPGPEGLLFWLWHGSW